MTNVQTVWYVLRNVPQKAIYANFEMRKLAHIDEKCIGCTLCKRNCSFEAIEGERKVKHNIIDDKCTGCESVLRDVLRCYNYGG